MAKILNDNVYIVDEKGYHFEIYKDYFIYNCRKFLTNQYINVRFLDIESIEYNEKSLNFNYTYTYTLNLHNNNSFEIKAKTHGQLSVLMEVFAIIKELRSRTIIELINSQTST